MNPQQTVGKGLLGTVSGIFAFEMPSWDAIDHTFRTLGIITAALVSLAMFVSIAFDIRRKWRDRNKP